MKGSFSTNVVLGVLVGVGAIFAFVFFAKLLALLSNMTREELLPWIAIGIPVLVVAAYALDQWLKNED